MTLTPSDYIWKKSSSIRYITKDTDIKLGFYAFQDSYNVSLTGTPYKKGSLLGYIVYDKIKKTVKSKMVHGLLSFFFEHYKITPSNLDPFEFSKSYFSKNSFLKDVILGKINTIGDYITYLRTKIFKLKCDNLSIVKFLHVKVSPHYIRHIKDPENLNYTNINKVLSIIACINLNYLRLNKLSFTVDQLYYGDKNIDINDAFINTYISVIVQEDDPMEILKFVTVEDMEYIDLYCLLSKSSCQISVFSLEKFYESKISKWSMKSS
jgi:hypothetical protein